MSLRGWTVCLLFAGVAMAAPATSRPAAAPTTRSGAAPAAESGPPFVHVLLVDGTQRDGRWHGANAEGFAIETDAGPVRIARDDAMLVAFDRPAAASRPAAEPERVTCRLVDGSIIDGELAAAPAEHAKLRTDALGELTLRFSDLRAIRYGSLRADARAQAEMGRWLAKPPSGADVLIVARDGNVTAVRGAAESVGPAGGQFAVSSRSIAFTPQMAFGIVFGSGPRSEATGPLAITLADGSVVQARVDGEATDRLPLVMIGGARVELPIAAITRIQVRSARVAFASDLPIDSARYEPLLYGHWPHRLDRSVANGPLRLGGVEYVKGIGVHARSELLFALDGTYHQFAATIGIDDAVRPRGVVIFRVVADGREVFNSGPVAGHDAAAPGRAIFVPIDGARQVRLIVDFGDALDLGDHADWANARFIR